MTLEKIKPNQKVKIIAIHGGHNVRQRLNQLGIYIGKEAMVKRGGPFGGPILLSMNQTDIAIGRGMASRVIVEIVEN